MFSKQISHILKKIIVTPWRKMETLNHFVINNSHFSKSNTLKYRETRFSIFIIDLEQKG
jgi:hypothetical protein